MQNQVFEGYQLSPQQRNLWPEQQRSPALHARCALVIEGDLDVDALFHTLRRLVERHEILRTSFARLPGMETPIQVVVADAASPACERCDLEGLTPAEREERLEDLLAGLGRSFDLEKPPLIRFAMARLDGAVHVLLMALPALCADALSLENLAREVEVGYADRTAAGGAAEDPLQYIEFSEWRHSLLEEPEAEQGRTFWRRQSRAATAPLDLPMERAACAAGAPFMPGSIALDPGPGVAARLQERAEEWGVPAAIILLATWQAVLRRLTGRAEIAVQVRFHGRKFPELQGSCGLFEQYLPVSVRLDDGITLPALAERTDRAMENVHVWQEYFVPGGGEGARSAAFEVETPAPEPAGGVLRFRLERRLCHTARFDVKLTCSPGGLPAVLCYDAAVYCAAEAGRLAGRLATLLADALENPGKSLDDLEILGEEERRRVLIEPNRTGSPFPDDRAIHHLFAERARLQPGSLAVSFAGSTLTFGELDARANRLARHLARLGAGPESAVALCLERSAEAVVALLAILKAGGAYVPLDAGQPRERLLRMLLDCRASLVVTERAHAAVFAGQEAPVFCLDAEREAVVGESGEDPGAGVLPDHPAYLIFTSGSTGHPKGAVIRHRSAVNLVTALAREVYAGIAGPLRVSVNAPLAFDASVKQILQLLHGHCLVVIPEEVRREGGALLDFLARERVQVLDCTPAQLRLLLNAGLDAAACPDLRLVLVGGEALDETLWHTLGGMSGIRFWNVYGPTECTVDATAFPIDGSSPRPVIGRPLANIRTYVLDAGWRPVPGGVVGELWIGGEGLARGYAQGPGVTAEKFVPDPFGGASGGRLYRTGDLARWRPEGELELTGRADQQVKVRGFRIELGEIESVLAGFPGLRESAVAARQEPTGDRRLVAYVVPAAGTDLEIDGLRSWLRERLPEYMLPTAFVRLDSLPLTRNGKVDRRALPVPEEAAGLQREAGHEPPRTQLQEMLAALWADALGYERIGVEANFFELGGHSLLATQLMARIRQTLRAEVPLRSLFEAPTVAGLAALVETILRAGTASEIPPLVPVPRDGPLPLSFAQQRLWFLDRLQPGNPFYNMPLRTRLTGSLESAALSLALAEIVRRHEVLRTRFAVVDGEPFQVIDPPPPPFLPVVDLASLPPAEGEAEALRLAAGEAAQPFDLELGPLLRAALLRLGEWEHVALLTTHHVASDGWSQGILLRELAILYDTFRQDAPSPLPELPVQYADFSCWQRSWLQGEALERQLEVWKRRLAGAPVLLELPLDRPRPAQRRYRGARRRLTLPPSLTLELHRLCRGERISTFMALLGAFQAVLSRLSRQDDVSVGSPVAGRDRVETEGLIGFFINTLVLRTDLSGDPDGRELLQRVREVVLEALAHQDLPFERLVDELRPERVLGHPPLFQVMLAFQNAAPEGERELPGLVVTPLGLDSEGAKFDLTLNLVEVGGRLGCVLDYDVDLFDADTAERFLGRFAVLLQALVADPVLRVSELPLLTEEERSQVLGEWSGQEAGRDVEGGTLPSLLAASVARWPERVAVSFGEHRLSYRDLGRRAHGLAHRLRELGVGPEVRVALCGPRSPEMVIALLAVLQAGGAWVPLEPAHPRERLSRMLADSGAAVLVTAGDPELVGEPGLVRLRLEDWSWPERDSPPAGAVDPEQAAYVIYTSGSTGQPKGVVVGHRGPCNLALGQSQAFGVSEQSRVLPVRLAGLRRLGFGAADGLGQRSGPGAGRAGTAAAGSGSGRGAGEGGDHPCDAAAVGAVGAGVAGAAGSGVADRGRGDLSGGSGRAMGPGAAVLQRLRSDRGERLRDDRRVARRTSDPGPRDGGGAGAPAGWTSGSSAGGSAGGAVGGGSGGGAGVPGPGGADGGAFRTGPVGRVWFAAVPDGGPGALAGRRASGLSGPSGPSAEGAGSAGRARGGGVGAASASGSAGRGGGLVGREGGRGRPADGVDRAPSGAERAAGGAAVVPGGLPAGAAGAGGLRDPGGPPPHAQRQDRP